MKSDKPFRKTLVCAACLYAALATFIISSGAENVSYRLGYTFSMVVVPGLITWIWAAVSKKSWSWGRFAMTVLGLWVFFSMFSAMGRAR